MKKITRSVHIKAPRSAVWAALADFGGVSRMSKGVLASRLTSETGTGVGATRHCDLADMGATVEERITAWEEGEAMDIDIYESTKLPMVTTMLAEFRLADEDEGTRLTAHMNYALGLGPIGWFMDLVMMNGMMNKNWTGFLAGIRHHVETGEELDANTRVDTSGIEVA